MKYEITKKKKRGFRYSLTLYRIKALKDFGKVKAGVDNSIREA